MQSDISKAVWEAAIKKMKKELNALNKKERTIILAKIKLRKTAAAFGYRLIEELDGAKLVKESSCGEPK